MENDKVGKVYKMIREKIDFTTVAYKMLLNNRIRGIATYEISEEAIYYDISNLTSLESYFKEKISCRQILNLLKNLNSNLKDINSYLLGFEDINEDLDRIFIDGDKKLYFTINFKGDSSYKAIFDKIRSKASLIIDGEEDKLVRINNILLADDGDIESVDNILNEGKKEDKNFGEKKAKEKKIEKKYHFKAWKDRVFKPKKDRNKPYKERNLNFDFKVPKI